MVQSYMKMRCSLKLWDLSYEDILFATSQAVKDGASGGLGLMQISICKVGFLS